MDWQIIGNILLRGVTPALRVLADQQKSRDSASSKAHAVYSLNKYQR
jgi:hypothetical protein